MLLHQVSFPFNRICAHNNANKMIFIFGTFKCSYHKMQTNYNKGFYGLCEFSRNLMQVSFHTSRNIHNHEAILLTYLMLLPTFCVLAGMFLQRQNKSKYCFKLNLIEKLQLRELVDYTVLQNH